MGDTEHYRPALFLDRDGVINVDRGYVHRLDEFEFVPGIFDLVRFAVHELEWPVVVITNQSGIGRGYFDESAFDNLTRWMCTRFEREGAPITKVYHCPYHPEHGLGAYRADHPWRKPKPGMILQAISDLHLDPAASALLGDKISDIEAGASAGVSVRIRLDATGAPPAAGEPSHLVARSLPEALLLLRARLVPSDDKAAQRAPASQRGQI